MSAGDYELLQRMSDRIEARTGYRPLGYVSAPTPSTLRIVVGQEAFASYEAARSRLGVIIAEITTGHWGHWVCRTCPWAFSTEAARDGHEDVEHGGSRSRRRGGGVY